jgi:hypothetical protein
MGIGISYINPNEKVWLRKSRWLLRTFPVSGAFNNAEPAFVYKPQEFSLCHMAGRPKVSFEKQEIKHVHETATYHGRPTWEPIELQIFNVAGDSNIYRWLQAHYDPDGENWGYRDEALVNMSLHLFNGVGEEQEVWELEDCWASMIDWGDLDYSSTELANCSITVEYIRARLTFSAKSERPSGPSGGFTSTPSATGS